MKGLLHHSYLIGLLLITACTPKYNYQVFNNVTAQKSGNIIYANEEINVEYDLWGDDLELLVSFTNKTEAPLYLDLSQSALVINGTVVTSYTETEMSTSVATASARSATYINKYGFLSTPSYAKGISSSVTYKSNPIIFLPPKSTYKKVFDYGRVASVYENPNAELKRSEKQKHLTFSKEGTPYTFRFNLGYAHQKEMQNMTFIDHEFWVESIDIMRSGAFLGRITGQIGNTSSYNYSFPYKKKNAFYLIIPAVKRTN